MHNTNKQRRQLQRHRATILAHHLNHTILQQALVVAVLQLEVVRQPTYQELIRDSHLEHLLLRLLMTPSWNWQSRAQRTSY